MSPEVGSISKGRRLLRALGRRRVVVPALTFALGLGVPSYWVFGGPSLKTAEPAELMAVIDPALRLPPVETSRAEENSYLALANIAEEAAGRKVDLTRLSQVLGGAEASRGVGFNDATALMNGLDPLFSKIDAALKLPRFQVVIDHGESSLDFMTRSLSILGKFEQYRARVYSAKGDSVNTLRAIQSLYRMAQTFGSGNGPLAMYSQGFNAKTMLGTAIRNALRDGALTDRDLQTLLASIPPEPATDEALARSIQTDFAWNILPLLTTNDGLSHFKTVVAATDAADGPLVGNLDYLATMKEASRLSAIAIANARRPYAQRDESVSTLLREMEKSLPRRPDPEELRTWWQRFGEDTKYRTAMKLIPNSLGKRMLVAGLDPEMTAQESFLGRTLVECARLQLAIEIYRRRHGALPDSLDALLADKILPALPVDHFADAPLKYDRKRAILWSVSFNGRDDNGKAGVAPTSGADIVFRIAEKSATLRP